MKNKKLIATVASLCLIVVAVVAAVVGVLAAAQQQANARIKVKYEAIANVYATVSINGKTELGDYGTEVSHTFNTVDQKTNENLEFSTTNKGLELSETGGKTNKYALYRFTFTNLNNTHKLKVTAAYKNTLSSNANIELFWVKSSDANWAPATGNTGASGANLTWSAVGLLDQNNNTLAGTTTAQAVSESGEVVYTDIINAGSNVTANTQYLYLVVAVQNLNNDADFAITGADTSVLTFTLDGVKVTA